MGQRWLLYVSTCLLQLNRRSSLSVAHRRYESFHRYSTSDVHMNKKTVMYTEHADRLLAFMPLRKFPPIYHKRRTHEQKDRDVHGACGSTFGFHEDPCAKMADRLPNVSDRLLL